MVAAEIRRRLADERAAEQPGALDELADGALADYLDASAATVTSLAAELAERARQHGMRLSFMDGGGPGTGWLAGIDLPALSAAGVGVQTLGYARTADAVREKVAAFALHGVRRRRWR